MTDEKQKWNRPKTPVLKILASRIKMYDVFNEISQTNDGINTGHLMQLYLKEAAFTVNWLLGRKEVSHMVVVLDEKGSSLPGALDCDTYQ